MLFLMGGALLLPPLAWLAARGRLQANVAYLPANYGHSGRRLAEAGDMCLFGGADLLFVGSSHCYRTFDTRCYDSVGFRSLNLGSSNQTPKQSYALLERYLEHFTPRRVVVEVHPDIMENNGNESAVDLISNTYLDPPMLGMALGQRNLRVFNTLLCSSFGRLLGTSTVEDSVVRVATRSGDTIIEADFAYVPGGYVEVTPYCYRPLPLAPKTISVRNDQMRWLRECLRLVERQGVPCLLVEVPATRARYASYTNHREFENQIRSLVNQVGGGQNGLRYLNLNDDERLAAQLDDSTCFFDDDHLNQKGADIFNKFFLSCLLSD